MKPSTDREVTPSGNMVRFCNLTGAPVHRASVANADGAGLVGLAKLGNFGGNDFPDPLGAAGTVDLEPASCKNGAR